MELNLRDHETDVPVEELLKRKVEREKLDEESLAPPQIRLDAKCRAEMKQGDYYHATVREDLYDFPDSEDLKPSMRELAGKKELFVVGIDSAKKFWLNGLGWWWKPEWLTDYKIAYQNKQASRETGNPPGSSPRQSKPLASSSEF